MSHEGEMDIENVKEDNNNEKRESSIISENAANQK